MLRSTPTPFTQSSTTASSEPDNWLWLTSCWYWPTPIDLGSIFTSSANGSCKRRAIDTAPRIETSRSGNSSVANSDAEYTDAPASLTITLVNSGWVSFTAAISSAASLSVSRDAVPLPIAINSTLCILTKFARVRIDFSHRFCGACGKIVAWHNILPVLSTTATFTPVRKPGSSPMVAFAPAGAAINKSPKLRAKTLMASASARSRICEINSVSICSAILMRHVAVTTVFNH